MPYFKVDLLLVSILRAKTWVRPPGPSHKKIATLLEQAGHFTHATSLEVVLTLTINLTGKWDFSGNSTYCVLKGGIKMIG